MCTYKQQSVQWAKIPARHRRYTETQATKTSTQWLAIIAEIHVDFFFYILICVSVAEAIVNITHFCCHYRILSCGILPQVAVKLKVIWVHSTNICGHKTVILWYRGSNDKIQDTLRYYHQTIKSQGHWMISQAPSKTKTMMCFIVMKINNYEE